jgi:hypothetical protein
VRGGAAIARRIVFILYRRQAKTFQKIIFQSSFQIGRAGNQRHSRHPRALPKFNLPGERI